MHYRYNLLNFGMFVWIIIRCFCVLSLWKLSVFNKFCYILSLRVRLFGLNLYSLKGSCQLEVRSGVTPQLLMLLEELCPRERLPTSGAVELFAVLMRLKMCPKIGSICKCPITYITLKWFLTRMSTDMSLKKPRTRECLSTDITFTWQCMCTNVHL